MCSGSERQNAMPMVSVETPIGRIGLVEEDDAITKVLWRVNESPPTSEVQRRAADQVGAYFAGELTRFDLPLKPSGSEFQKAVYRQMLAIPFGETRTYGEIAKALDGMPQPVGQACGSNPIPIIIPCHRVLAANGLGGFSGFGGVEMKITLLRHENAYPYLI